MDPIRLAGAALGAGVTGGLALIAVTVAVVEAFRPAAGSAANTGAPFYLLMVGTLGGIAAAGAIAWLLLAPVPSTYRRWALAMVTAFATVPLMLVCLPVHQLFGRAGLFALAGFTSVLAFLLARRARPPAEP